MPKMKAQFSAGGVIYRRCGGHIEIVLLTRDEGKVFCLPKGKIEKAETSQEAAIREVKEETGLSGTIEQELGVIKYHFLCGEENILIDKTVDFYLMKYESGDTSGHDADAEEARWLAIEEAIRIITYPSEREMVEKADKLLSSKDA